MNARGKETAESGKQGEGTLAQWNELVAQIHELEVLMEETEVSPALLSAYWEASADLIALVEEVHTVMAAVRADLLDARTARERYLQTRQRVISLQARAQELTLLDAGGDEKGLESW